MSQYLKLKFKQLDAAMKSMNLEKITATMDKFEKSFENLDLTTSVMEGSMGDAMATSAPSGQVDALIQQVFLLLPSYVHLYQYNPRLQTNIIYKLQAIWQRHLWRIQGYFSHKFTRNISKYIFSLTQEQKEAQQLDKRLAQLRS